MRALVVDIAYVYSINSVKLPLKWELDETSLTKLMLHYIQV